MQDSGLLSSNSPNLSDTFRLKSARRENFFHVLRDELLSIPNLPLAKTMMAEQTSFYESMVSHMADQKTSANTSVHAPELTDYLKTQQDKLTHLLDSLEKQSDEPLSFDLFGIERGNCNNCNCKLYKCYEANGRILGKSGLNCVNCNCPSNSHKIIDEGSKFSDMVGKLLISRSLNENHIDFKSMIAIFITNDLKTVNLKVRKLINIMAQAGFRAIETNQTKIEKIRNLLFKKKIFGIKKEMRQKDFEILQLMLNSELENEKINDWEFLFDSFLKERDDICENDAKILHNILEKINDKINKNKGKTAILINFLLKKDTNISYFPNAFKLLNSKDFHLFYYSKNSKNSILDTQIFFGDIFKLKIMTLLSFPNLGQNELGLQDRIKDLLQLNSFSLLDEKIIKQNNLMKSLENTGRANLLFSSSFFGENGCHLSVCSKFGIPSFYDFNIKNSVNFMKITEDSINDKLFTDFFPEISQNQRIMLIIRPHLIQTDFEEIICNIFRLNEFTLIKRIYCKLTENQAYYLSKIEKIPVSMQKTYINFMRNGPVQLLLLTNFGGIKKAKIICGNELFIHEKIELNEIDKEFPINPDNWLERTVNFNIFKGLKELFSLSELINQECEAKNLEEKNTAVGEFRKQLLFKEQQKDLFNYIAFSTENETETEELVSIFMPECSAISVAQILIKPNYSNLSEEIKNLLISMKFKIFKQKKIKLTEDQVYDLFSTLNDNFSADNEFTDFWTNEIEILSIAKISCRKEIFSLLSDFSVFQNFSTQTISKSQIQNMLVPCWTNESHFYSLRLLDPNLVNFPDFLVISDQDQRNILNYILMNCFADEIDEKSLIKQEIFSNSIDIETDSHYYWSVNSKNLGSFEIRIRKELYCNEPQLIEFDYKLLGWYYSLVNDHLYQKCPLTYQFRIFELPNEKHQIFDCQQFVGNSFIKEITEQIKANKEPDRNSIIHNNSSSFFKNQRGSLIAYIWGVKLALYIKALETVKVPKDITGYGKITLIEGKLKGENKIGDNLHIYEEKNLFDQICKRISNKLGDIFDIQQIYSFSKNEERQLSYGLIQKKAELISKKLDLIFNSDSYKYSRKSENLRILPTYLSLENLRIFCDRAQIFNCLLHGEFETLAFDYETQLNHKKPSDFHYNGYCLVNTLPSIKTKYSLAGMISFYLEIGIKNQNENEDNDLNKLLEGIVEGFNKAYHLDSVDLEFLQSLHKDTVIEESYVKKKILNLIKIETFLFGLNVIDRELIFMTQKKNEIDSLDFSFKEKMLDINQSFALAEKEQIMGLGEQKKLYEKNYLKEIALLNKEIIFTKKNVRFLIDKLSEYSLFFNHEEFFLAEKSNRDIQKVKIPKEKYFIPFVNEVWEKNLEDHRYKRDLNEKFENIKPLDKYGGAVFYKNINKDPIQQKWVENRPLVVNYLRKFEKEEKDGILVEKIAPNAEQMLKNALDKEIRKFEDFKKQSKML